jgi:drug/metabolite transporter (DMT)-like permease
VSGHRWTDYLLIAGCLVFTVYGQMVLKWRMDQLGPLPEGGTWVVLRHLVGLIVDPVILSSFVAAFFASLAWMAAMTKFELSYAYPFTSLNFVAVLVLSVWLLGESMTLAKALGIGLIVLGTVIASGRTA